MEIQNNDALREGNRLNRKHEAELSFLGAEVEAARQEAAQAAAQAAEAHKHVEQLQQLRGELASSLTITNQV